MNYYKFTPLQKTLIWGTESWQLSGVEGSETTTDGGLTLNQLVLQEQERLLGASNYQRFGNEFPLLIKFIDAHQNLSIQVHPNDEVAQRHGKPHGKTEMWYVMDSAPGATLYNGLKMRLTPQEYERMVEPRTKAQERIRELRPKLSVIKHNQPNLKVDGKTAKRVEADIKKVEQEIKQQLDLIKKIDKAVQDAIKRNKALKEDAV